MHLLSRVLAPFRFLLRLFAYPLRLRMRSRALREHGWVELHLEGNVYEHRPASKLPPFVRRLLRREEEPRVVMSRLRKMVDELLIDPHAKGILVRLGLLGGGWVSAHQIREQLERLKEAGKEVLIHLVSHAGNREYAVAAGGTRLLMTPVGAIAAVGAAGSTLFLKDTLAKAGVKLEVAARGKYKSAPEQFTRTSRSENDLEQTKALVDQFDGELVRAIMAGRQIDAQAAKSMIDRAPIVGRAAKASGYCDGLARDEDLPAEIQALEHSEAPLKLVGAGAYLQLRSVAPPFQRRRKNVGIVEVHGAIADRGSPLASYFDRLAVQKAVVHDLRAALEDDEVDAVVLHVDSRGGSVTASDAIYAAVRRLNEEKPVIACFGEFAASGGYYVACGARNIVASPLTITGSIGVFAMYPSWPELGRWLGVHHDIVKNHKNAAIYDPWDELSEETRRHADGEVGAMYEAFLDLVAQAREKTRDDVNEVAQGRVWTGRDAHERGLVDGLGGMPEALERAKEAAGGRFADEPVLIRSWRAHPRPDPFEPDGDDTKKNRALWASGEAALVAALFRNGPVSRIVEELFLLSATSIRTLPLVAYAPIEIG